MSERAGLILIAVCLLVGLSLLLLALYVATRPRRPHVPRLGPGPAPLNLTPRNAAAIRYGIELAHEHPRTDAFDRRLEREVRPLTREAYHRTRDGLVRRAFNANPPRPPRPRPRD